MPFTIGGDYLPSDSHEDKGKSGRPVKVRREKRRNAWVTRVLNLTLDPQELKSLAATIKKRCGCGGTVKDGVIEVQGDKVEEVRKELAAEGIKAQ